MTKLFQSFNTVHPAAHLLVQVTNTLFKPPMCFKQKIML